MYTRQECQQWAQNPWYNPRTGRRLRAFGIRSPQGQFLAQCARYGPQAYPVQFGVALPPTLAVPERPLYPVVPPTPAGAGPLVIPSAPSLVSEPTQEELDTALQDITTSINAVQDPNEFYEILRMSQGVAPQLDTIAEETASQVIAEESLTSVNGQVVEEANVSPVVDAKEQERLQDVLALSTSEVLRNFQDFKRLGAGSFGTTYSAKDVSNDNTIVIKQIDKEGGSPRSLVMEEVKVLGELQSVCGRYILCFVEFREDAQNYYIITEFLGSYITLNEYIEQQKGSQSPEMSYKIISNLFRGIQQIHKNNVAHRDVKPENIMINPLTGDIKYIDFGVSCFDKDCNTQSIAGSDAFMAPEIRYGTGPFNKQKLMSSDLWSLAFTIFELITGSQLQSVYWERIYVPMMKFQNPKISTNLIVQPELTMEVFEEAIYQASTQGEISKAIDLLPRTFQEEYPQVVFGLKSMIQADPSKRNLFIRYFI